MIKLENGNCLLVLLTGTMETVTMLHYIPFKALTVLSNCCHAYKAKKVLWEQKTMKSLILCSCQLEIIQ